MPRALLVLLLALVVLALLSPGSAPARAQLATPGPDPAANEALVRQMIDDVYNAHDLLAIDTYIAADYVDHEPDPSFTTGRHEFKQSAAAIFASFPDIRYEIQDLATEGDEIWTRTRICGTQTGAFRDIPATGRHICIEAFDTVRIASGKIVEHWGMIDELGLLRQLGVLPGA